MYFRVYRNATGVFPLRKYVVELYDAETEEMIERGICFKWGIERRKRRILSRAPFILAMNA